jgi:hypothetical protein
MAARRVKHTIGESAARRPLIYELGHRFKVVTNIRRAELTPDFGWVVLELQGDEPEIEACLRWAAGEGVVVSPVIGDIVAG